MKAILKLEESQVCAVCKISIEGKRRNNDPNSFKDLSL